MATTSTDPRHDPRQHQPHRPPLYNKLTDNRTRPVRVDDLLYDAAERVPGLVPTRAAVDAELQRKLADKEGVEIAQGLSSRTCSPPAPGATWCTRCSARGARGALESCAHRRGRPRPGAGRAPRAGRLARAAQPAPAERRGRRHARPDRGGSGPDPARPRDRGRRLPRRRGGPPALRRPAHLRRGAEPHPSLPRAGRSCSSSRATSAT